MVKALIVCSECGAVLSYAICPIHNVFLRYGGEYGGKILAYCYFCKSYYTPKELKERCFECHSEDLIFKKKEEW